MTCIAAIDRNYGIGRRNTLPAKIPADLKRFRQVTSGGIVVMGRKTYESLPTRPLPERENIVLTSSPERFPEIRCVRSAAELFPLVQGADREVFLCGGAMVYAALLPYCEKALITEIDTVFEADAFFPPIRSLPEWEKVEESEPILSNGFTVRFCTYRNLNGINF